ncbi:MAG TPA: ligase-associated DNA damage response endonuclease PdeM [Candidatus Udaeobacter sp.]|nr:ligase-associated DNA damage response endonuclease PdeM [Candidatus Udaeobacter sp.]
MSGPIPLRLNGAEVLADISGALFWPERRLLAVADLHLEKGSGFASRGRLLPPYDTAATLLALSAAIERHDPAVLVCLGDSFHDCEAAGRLGHADRTKLSRLTRERDWIWIAGNHDPVPPASLGGRVLGELVLGPLVFRHIAAATATGEVSGHFHPKAGLSWRGRYLGGRCFIGDDRRLILPAFGAYAGGLDVLDPAIRRLFSRRAKVHILGPTRLYSFPAAQLAAV